MLTLLRVVAVSLLLVGLSGPARGQTVLYVDLAANGTESGLSWNDAYTNLQQALVDAEDIPEAEEIRIAGGTYVPLLPGGVPSGSDTFALPAGKIVRGGYAGVSGGDPDQRDPNQHETILSGMLNATDRSPNVVTATGPPPGTALDGVTIRDGAGTFGAGLRVEGGDLLVRGVRFEANSASGSGGAVHALGGATLRLDDCTLQGNSAGTGGGALYNQDADTELNGCTLRANTTAFTAAGIYHLAGTLTLRDCAILDHSGGQAGVVRCDAGTTLVAERTVFRGSRQAQAVRITNVAARFEDCWFEDNQTFGSTGSGPAINAFDGTLTLLGCTFLQNAHTDNTNLGRGGAIQARRLTFDVQRCRFLGNRATSGGGALFMFDCDGAFTSCLFSGNEAAADSFSPRAGAVDVFSAPVAFVNCSFVGNLAASDGGGVCIDDPTAGLSPSFDNCLFWGNQDAAGGGQSAQIGLFNAADPVIRYSCVQGWTGSLGGVANFGLDPLLRDAPGADGLPGTLDDDLALGGGSPCVDAGDSTALPAGSDYDALGGLRVVDDPNAADVGIANVDGVVVDIGGLERGGRVPCLADVNGDGVVNQPDLIAILLNFGQGGASFADGDLDGDGVVALSDLALLLREWNRQCPLDVSTG